MKHVKATSKSPLIDFDRPLEDLEGNPVTYYSNGRAGMAYVLRADGGPLYPFGYEGGGYTTEVYVTPEEFRGGYEGEPIFLRNVSSVAEPASSLPEDDAARNELPMFDGLLAYFPNALAAVAQVSKIGNDQHNPGEQMHWARGKSTDHLNKIVRHTVDAGKKDARGVRHSARLAWRALALLQEELEREEGAPLARGAKI
jgi:hypothetical protein